MAALGIRDGLPVALASLVQNTALRHVGFSSCAPGLESSGSVAVVMGFAALWIFQDQG